MNLIEEHNKEESPDSAPHSPSKCRQFLLNPITIAIFIILCLAITVPVLVYYLVINRGSYPEPFVFSCSVNPTYRVPCGPPNASEEYCTQTAKCCFDGPTERCYHYLPSQHFFYQHGDNYQPNLDTTPLGLPTTKQLAFSYSEISESILKLYVHDAATPVKVERFSGPKNYVLRTQFSDGKLNPEVYRNDNFTLLLTTLYGPLVFSKEHLEWTFQLSDEYLFGLGQTLIDLDDNSTLTRVIYSNANDHTTLPVFVAKRGKQFHGVKVRCNGLLEVTVLPSKLIILRVVRGNAIELEIAVGPTIQKVVEQQKNGQKLIDEIVDDKLFGMHVCREGNLWDVDEMVLRYNEFVQKMLNNSLDVSSDCIHANLFPAMLLNDINLTGTVISTPVALSLPPQVVLNSPFFDTISDTVSFYKNTSDGGTYHGMYFGEKAVFPYFEDAESSRIYGESILKEIDDRIGSVPLYFTLYNNWPLDEDFTDSGQLDELLYFTEEMKKALLLTLPWNVQAPNNKSHIEEHNNYASSQVATITNLFAEKPNKPFLFTAGHNLDTESSAIVFIQNTDISWTNFAAAIRKMLFNSISGNGLVGIPVCGSSSNYDPKLHEALCIRWYMMASTAPMFQVSSVEPYRDPFLLNTKHATQLALKALEIRENLRYYIYTTFKENQPLVRPLFYQFPEDVAGYGLDAEYMMGGGILVAHPVVPNAPQLRIYLPVGVAVWYEIWSGLAYQQSQTVNGTILFNLFEGDWVGFVAEGSIIPFKITEDVDEKTYIKPIVALQSGNETARGVLWIGLNRFELEASNSSISIVKTAGGSSPEPAVFLKSSVVLSVIAGRRVLCNTELDLMGISDTAAVVEFEA